MRNTIYFSLLTMFVLSRKCRAQLMKINIKTICLELSKMFPVSGKTNSFSLRTSAQLTYGVVLIFKYNIEAVRKDILRMRKLSYQGKTQTKVLVLVM